jgi:NADPH:quinone reductase
MQAIVVHQPGGPEAMSFEEVEIKKPGPGQVLVRVAVAGVNFIDIYQRRGTYPKKTPFIPGMEGAGVIEEVGEGVSYKKGDRVAFLHEPGSYAEACLVKTEHLIPIPDDFSFQQGAAFPLQGMTAQYLLHEFRMLKPDDVVLIHAAAGGMGLLLVQWARHLKATTVIGTVSTEEKAQAAYKAGAEFIINYTKQDFVTEVKRLTNDKGADLIIDGVGKTTFAGNLKAAARRGNIVIFGAASGPADPIAPNSLMERSLTLSGGSLSNFILTPDETTYRAGNVIQGIKQGWLKLTIAKVFPLEEAAEAHRMLENRETIGKVLLVNSNF